MKIYWKTQKDYKKIQKLAKSNIRVAKRMIQIDEAMNFLDIIPTSNGRAHFLKGNKAKLFAIDVYCKNDPRRYICEPYGDGLKTDSNGNYIKESIIELIILKIERNYH